MAVGLSGRQEVVVGLSGRQEVVVGLSGRQEVVVCCPFLGSGFHEILSTSLTYPLNNISNQITRI